MRKKQETQSEKTRQKRVGSLKTRGNILSEIGKVYREVRRGELQANDGKAMASILQGAAQVIKDGDADEVMRRIAALQEKLEGKGKPVAGEIDVIPPPPLKLMAR